MLKKLIMVLSLITLTTVTSFAQSSFDLSKVTGAAKDKLTPIGDWLAAGSSAMMWTSASAPTAFGFGIGVYVSAGSIPEITIPGVPLEIPKFGPNNLGIRATAGTLGAEIAVKYMPTVLGISSLGFGAKYEVSKFLPLPPAFPVSLAGYVDYNKVTFKADDNEFEFKNTSFGVLASGDLFIVTLYGRLGFETGSGSLSWKYTSNGISVNEGIDLDSNGMRVAAGLKLLGINLEVGSRTELYYAAGYGFSF